jgi:N6-L-threonylcarbamoyladenine synthase
MPLILGIESSCDETAAAVVRDGAEVLSNVISSQIATHSPYGGVVPELASREHLRAIVPVVRQALSAAQVAFDQLDALAVTQGPGLAGALLVGITYAKALSFALKKPLIAVNHLEGHIHAALLASQSADLSLPALALVVSGGHTHLYVVDRKAASWHYRNVGKTLDDAAGEAFDKIAKLLGLSYPGGPIIEKLAVYGNPAAVPMPKSHIKAQEKRRLRGNDSEQSHDFSFSGLKTAVLRYVETHDMKPGIELRRRIPSGSPEEYLAVSDKLTLDLIASFQRAVVGDLVRKTLRAAEEIAVTSLIVTGGVAANGALREAFQQRAARSGMNIYFPLPGLFTDNAAMIAAAAFPRLVSENFASAHFCAEATFPLGI